MIMANKYELGDLVRVKGTWTDPNNSNAAIDPDVVKCSVRAPSGTVTTYTFGTDAALTKVSTGVYQMDINANAAGIWSYRWFSTGAGQAADERYFEVSVAYAQ
ncbi:conserved hypothetical protein [Gammaproteobacteria bacterium]